MSPDRLVGLPLARGGVDRAALRRLDDAWLDAAWADPASRVVLVHDGRVLARTDNGRVELHLLPPADVPTGGERLLLGVRDDGIAVFAWHTREALAGDGDGVKPMTLRELGLHVDDLAAGLAVHAIGLANWHAAHTHCSRCGTPTEVSAAGHLRRCPRDGSEHFPRTDPAVIMLVTDPAGDRALLGRHVDWPPTSYSTLAGFVEPGESLERAVAREVFEESAVQVDLDSVTYLGSQPWPFPSSLMLGFFAQSNDIDAARPDGQEMADVIVVTRDELARRVTDGQIATPPSFSISRRLIERWFGAELSSVRAWT
ncbi:MAG: NAD(+) diphosphatase [Candidatus Nanopelagicales bacterium]